MKALRQLFLLGAWNDRRLLAALAAGSAAAVVWMAAQVAIPLLTGAILDRGVLARDAVALRDRVIALVAAATLSTVAKGVHQTAFAWLSERARAALELRLLARLHELPVAYFDGERTGRLQRLLADDTASVARGGCQVLGEAMQAVLQLGLILAVLVTRYGRIAFAALAVVPIYMLFPLLVGRRTRDASRDALSAAAEAAAIRHESIQAVREIRLFGIESWAADRLGASLHDETGRQTTLAILRSAYGLNYAVYFLAAGVVYWLGGLAVLDGQLTLGKLVALVALLASLDYPVSTLSRLGGELHRVVASAESIARLLAVEPAAQPLAGGTPLGTGGHRVRFDEVGFRHAGAAAPTLEGISFTVDPGERVALVGPSGAGKSTLAALLSRLYDPQQGRIWIDGHDHRDCTLASLRREVGFVLQDTFLFAGTIADNIRLGRRDASDLEVEQSARLANAHEFILRLARGYDSEVGERGVKLSGGQRQRLGIARMLLRKPGILVLDEAMSALDAPGERLVRDALVRLMAGRTTLSISHRPSVFADADRILVLDGGRIVAAGRHQELLRHCELYRGLAGAEQQAQGAAAAASAVSTISSSSATTTLLPTMTPSRSMTK
jgi:ABC-type multidrug transport system fused ATPase/permease subunit